MQDSSPIELRFHRLYTFSADELAFIIAHTKGTFTLEVLCESIGKTQSYFDIAIDLLHALFIGETVAEFCQDGSFYEDWDDDEKCQTINFVLTPQNPAELAQKLHELSKLFAENEDDDEYDEIDMLEAVSEFQDQLHLFEEKKYHFPLLFENYFFNYIIGLHEGIPEDISEVDKDDHLQVQEYIHENSGYIQSLYPHGLACDFYRSAWNSAWIILSDSLIDVAKLEQMLAVYGDRRFKPIELQDASVIATQNFDSVVFSQGRVIKYPFEQLTKAQQCVADISFIKKGITIDPQSAAKAEKNLLSDSDDILIVVDQMAQYIFFGDALLTVPRETLSKMAESSPQLSAYLDNH